MNYKENSLRKYLDDLAARLPAPGGGSAAALSAAMGASLLCMMVNFTLGKAKYAKYEKELQKIIREADALRKEFLNLVDLDVVAYQSKNLRDALDVPFTICRLCLVASKLCLPLAKKGNVNLISDVAVAAVLLEAAFTSAAFNVEINLRAIGDKKLSQVISKELKKKEKTIKRIRIETEAKVGEIIRG
jgi:formiminotetrahydrofolate cyclodeaminase